MFKLIIIAVVVVAGLTYFGVRSSPRTWCKSASS